MFLAAAWVVPLVCILVSKPASAQSPVCRFEHCLKVNNSDSDGPGSLYQALAEARLYNFSVEIQLPGGKFTLTDKALATFQEWDGFSLTGQGIGVTSIKCSIGMGMFFNASRNLVFRGFSISGCGREFITTSIKLGTGQAADPVSYIRSKTGMYFNLCSNLTFEDFQIYACFGAGITIYNTNGDSVFRNCKIQTNFLDDDRFPGGGGVIIETSHCTPGDSNCQNNRSVVEETRNSSFLFHNCTFSSNVATSRSEVFAVSFPCGKAHMALGKGGGLAVALKGRAYSNRVIIDLCDFRDNHAEWGGAIHLSFGDNSVNNSVVVSNSSFLQNNWNQDKTDITAGGAVRIAIVSYPPGQELWDGYTSDVTGNSITFSDNRFLQNFGSWGGAVSFVTTRNVPGQTLPNSLMFRRCTFLQNGAKLAASAVDISTWTPDVIDSHEQYLVPVFEDCKFYFNSIQFRNITNYPMGKGALYIHALPTKFLGTNTFLGNSDTAMVVSDTYVIVTTSSVMNFTLNTGRRGGALAFLGNSWMIVHEDTHILFDGNAVEADGQGGAVYSVHVSEHNLYFINNCFFQYHKFSETPLRWNATFVFRNNTANHQANSIYTTSLLPCTWGSLDDVAKENAFCENSTWIFEGEGRNCRNEISTGPGRIGVTKINFDVVPGWNVKLGVTTYDDFNRPLPTLLMASPSLGEISISDKSSYILDDTIVIHGMENSINNLLLMTLDPRVIASTVRINVKNCPVGFQSVSCTSKHAVGQTCDCVCISIPGTNCNDTTKEAYLHQFNCVTYSSDNNSLLTSARCPYNHKVNLSLTNISDLNDQVCGKVYRRGYLCNECKEGYGVSVNGYDYSCVWCKGKGKYNWALFLLLELGPITLVCFLVVLFRVRLVSPSMNAFVFFSQIVSIKYYHNSNCWLFGVDYVHHPSLSIPVFFLYGIWNLDFFREVVPSICLHESLNTLHVLVINYVKAFYPMLVLMVCFICIKLYDRHVRVIRFLWKPFHSCLKVIYRDRKPTTSMIDAFTTLIVLSYTKIMYVSFPLTSVEPIHQVSADGIVTEEKYYYYFHQSLNYSVYSSNIVYFLLGVMALIVFVGFPPLFLILYSFHFVQSYTDRLNTRLRIALGTFADSFLGAFRDGTDGDRNCRWFGGAYLLFRVIIFGVYISQSPWLNQYFIQQILLTLAILLFAIVRPYKIDFYNYLDVSFFTFLAILNSMGFYNSQQVSMSGRVNTTVFYINYILMYLPMLYLTLLLVYRILLWSGHIQQLTMLKRTREHIVNEFVSEEKERAYDSEITLPYDENEELPDRLVHPHLYNSLSPMSTMQSDVKQRSSQKAMTENSHLLPSDAEVPYGSVPKKQERFTVP